MIAPTPSTHLAAHTIKHWSVLEVSGNDVAGFLQGQITNDISLLDSTTAIWAAHCNVKGRALANFVVLRWSEKTFLLAPQSTGPILTSSLQKYGIFNQIRIQTASFRLLGICPDQWDAPWQTLGLKAPKPIRFSVSACERGFAIRFSENAICVALLTTAEPCNNTSDDPDFHAQEWAQEWDRRLIDAELGFITQSTCESFIPIELNMDQNGGISFSKGCYLGQEIIARLHYKSSPKQRLTTLRLPENCPPLSPGDQLFKTMETTTPIATIIQVVQAQREQSSALAVVRLAEITSPSLTVGAITPFAGKIKTPAHLDITLPTLAQP